MVQETTEGTDDKHKEIEKIGKEADDIKTKLEGAESQLAKAKTVAAFANKAATGVSVIQWSADSKEDAEKLVS